MGRYKTLTGEFADLMLGYYGETLGMRDAKVMQAAAAYAKKESIVVRPADLMKPEWEELRAQTLALKGCDGSDEDVLTHAMFPQVAAKFFTQRANGPRNMGKPQAGAAASPGAGGAKSVDGKAPVTNRVSYQVRIGDRTHQVTVEPA